MVAAKVWGVSDPHLFHEFVSGLRGYTAAEFNKLFVEDWTNKVATKDQVWLLGDLTGGGHINEALELVGELPGEKHLMIHFLVIVMHIESLRSTMRYSPLCSSIQRVRSMVYDALFRIFHIPEAIRQSLVTISGDFQILVFRSFTDTLIARIL